MNLTIRALPVALLVALWISTASADAPSGSFSGTPAFSPTGLATVVFGGGTVDQLEAAARAGGAAGVWSQDSGGAYVLLAVGAPSFVNDGFRTKFPAGLGLVAVTLVRSSGAASPSPSPTVPGPASLSVAIPRPDPSLTPGDVFPATVATICVSGYSATVRDVPDSEKDQVYAEYGITSHPTGAYEVDHLIPLEIGGSNDLRNLWPEPEQGDSGSLVKDRLENKLHDLVCAGSPDLGTAQRDIASDWYAAYQRYVLGSSSTPSVVPTPAPTTVTITPTPTTATVTAGAFCAPGGGTGVTVTGLAMVCTTSATDTRNRWRQP